MAGSVWEDTEAIIAKLDTIISLLQTIAEKGNQDPAQSGD